VGVFKEVLLARSRPPGVAARPLRTSLLLTGNPGTGKSTVAALLAAAHFELAHKRPPAERVLTTAPRLLAAKDPLKELNGALARAGAGGVLVVDDLKAFAPSPAGAAANASAQVLERLLSAMKEAPALTVLLVGGEADAERLAAWDPAFRARFPPDFTHALPDFSEAQLRQVFVDMVRQAGCVLAPKAASGARVSIARVLAARVARQRGLPNFRNALEVEAKLERALAEQKARLGSLALRGVALTPADYRTLTREDVLGPPPDFAASPVMRDLGRLVGQARAKRAIKELLDVQLQNYAAEAQGERVQAVSLHRVFVGNPGTGALRARAPRTRPFSLPDAHTPPPTTLQARRRWRASTARRSESLAFCRMAS
jgi:hypothetical protein